MCNLSQAVWKEGWEKGWKKAWEKGEASGVEKGIRQGYENGRLSAVRDLMQSTGWNADEAMAALRIPEIERLSYLRKLS